MMEESLCSGTYTTEEAEMLRYIDEAYQQHQQRTGSSDLSAETIWALAYEMGLQHVLEELLHREAVAFDTKGNLSYAHYLSEDEVEQ